jgi:Cys-tRNA(Pro)/Cys-tRNA(Cys) deacylase
MKKNYPTFIDKSAMDHDKIFFSAGIRGTQIEISPMDLIGIIKPGVGQISN